MSEFFSMYVHSGKLTSQTEIPPFEDVSYLENGGFSIAMLGYQRIHVGVS